MIQEATRVLRGLHPVQERPWPIRPSSLPKHPPGSLISRLPVHSRPPSLPHGRPENVPRESVKQRWGWSGAGQARGRGNGGVQRSTRERGMVASGVQRSTRERDMVAGGRKQWERTTWSSPCLCSLQSVREVARPPWVCTKRRGPPWPAPRGKQCPRLRR
jgi:hypothetical protein